MPALKHKRSPFKPGAFALAVQFALVSLVLTLLIAFACVMNVAALRTMWLQLRTLRYQKAVGYVLSSSAAGEGNGLKNSPIRYVYTYNGQEYISSMVRYPFLQGKGPLALINPAPYAARKPGEDLRIYVYPRHPEVAVLERGLTSGDLLLFLALLPLNAMAVYGLAKFRQTLLSRKASFGGVLYHQYYVYEPLPSTGICIRLAYSSPCYQFIGVVGVAALPVVMISIKLIGELGLPQFWVALVATGIVLGSGIASACSAWRRNMSGEGDIMLCFARKQISIPAGIRDGQYCGKSIVATDDVKCVMVTWNGVQFDVELGTNGKGIHDEEVYICTFLLESTATAFANSLSWHLRVPVISRVYIDGKELHGNVSVPKPGRAMQMLTSIVLSVFIFFMLLLTGFCLIWLSASLFHRLQEMAKPYTYTRTSARIVSTPVEGEDGAVINVEAEPVQYLYTFGGREFTGHRVLPGLQWQDPYSDEILRYTSMKNGTEVVAWVDPYNPQTAVLERGPGNYDLAAVEVCIFFITVLLVVIFKSAGTARLWLSRLGGMRFDYSQSNIVRLKPAVSGRLNVFACTLALGTFGSVFAIVLLRICGIDFLTGACLLWIGTLTLGIAACVLAHRHYTAGLSDIEADLGAGTLTMPAEFPGTARTVYQLKDLEAVAVDWDGGQFRVTLKLRGCGSDGSNESREISAQVHGLPFESTAKRIAERLAEGLRVPLKLAWHPVTL